MSVDTHTPASPGASERLESLRGVCQKLEDDIGERRAESARAHEEAAQANATVADLRASVETSQGVTQRTLAEQKKTETELGEGCVSTVSVLVTLVR